MKVFSAVVCAILLAGTNAARDVNLNAGDFYAFGVLAIGYEIELCRLKTPGGEILDFTPGVVSQHGDKYELQPISEALLRCAVKVSNLQTSDNGLWEISSVNTAANAETSERYQLLVSNAADAETQESEEIIVNENIIEFPTRAEQIIDLSLPRIDHEEECSIRFQDGNYTEASKVDIPGVQVHKSSYFVSCRFTVGPMVESLLGKWTVCGKYTENHKKHVRCQVAKIYWNPEVDWHHNVQPIFDHPVHFGSSLAPAVIGSGEVVECHIITPAGEDLVINQDSNYPLIKATYDYSMCTFAIGPIQKELLGKWVVYGLFRSLILGLNEERLPFNMFLYDEEDPFNQAYNRTVLDPVIRPVSLGSTLNVGVSVNAGQVDSCSFETPSGEVYEKGQAHYFNGASFVEENDGSVACRVAIGPITNDLLVNWKISGKFSNNGLFIERQQTFHLIPEDPNNPIQEDRLIVNLTAETVNMEMGNSDRLVIPSHELVNGESCHIRTPKGLQYQIMKGFTAVPGIEIIEEDGIECGVVITALSEDVVGEWTLIARASLHSEPIERRLPFTINFNSGDVISTSTLSVVRDRSVEQDVGPESAVYCRLEDPQGVVVFDGFGRCHLSLGKVELEHHGIWKMLVAARERILTEEHQLVVNVRESEGKALVATKVTQEKPIVTISCSIQTNATVTGCKFRNPHGKILIAASGLSEDRYAFYGKGSSYDSGVFSHECGIQITDPLTTDLGLWRCTLDTAEESYYGHMPVLCPWALSNPAVAAVVQQEPILRATRSLVSAVEEEQATMSCSVEAVIRYCYFRASNGTTFTVTPGMSSSSMEYVGAGFDAGECGIRFHHGLNAPDSGRWSCHVGLNGVVDEQRDNFQITVHERMQVRHFTGHGNVMTVEGIVYQSRALEYCRFVRIDGFGFTSDNVPSQYSMTGILANGECQFQARGPTILDIHPWTIAARIRGQDVEIVKDTMESVIIEGPESSGPESENNPGHIVIYQNNGLLIFLYVFLTLLFVFIVIGGLFGPKKNRQWTAQKASSFRRSLSGGTKPQQSELPAPNYTP